MNPLGSAPARDVVPLGGGGDDLSLGRLYEARQWFELRSAVDQGNDQTFYRGAVAYAFNRFDECSAYLSPILETPPSAEQAYHAHRLLSWANVRKGNFAQALKHLRAMLGDRQGNATPGEAWPLFSTLALYPAQSLVQGGACTVVYRMLHGNMFIPSSVNGKPMNFMIDSGANISLITQSEASRLGLMLHDLPAGGSKMYGATGAQTDFQVAVASRFTVGDFHLANVAFLVLKNGQLDFPAGYKGALGLTVLLAFQTLSWQPDGNLQIGFRSAQGESQAPNLCFDDADPVVQVVFQDQKLGLVLDTGNGRTILGQPFSARFAELLSHCGSKSQMQIHGVSGSATAEVVTLPRLTLTIGEADFVLSPAHVLLRPTTPNSRWLFGSLGLDLLNQAQRVKLDFPSMVLTLE